MGLGPIAVSSETLREREREKVSREKNRERISVERERESNIVMRYNGIMYKALYSPKCKR